ncbi:hypothetical protein F5B22DRAFT_620284 [Xylaria bambusicola]|uniref:uncharacterized protein n=1 Tax=Xylaria bambusicola TaxID=326684 RepID=UPI0020076C08|nr:uncharacterized protein F5B22DRAFT_620284 [Xylaria bambusicola]KAI0508562.1 hypothetical protein F5B22DRAFT_620284 [Xylaria bambusicola]
MAAPAAAAGVLSKTFRTGKKKIFLPSHTVKFLAPKPNQHPAFATFEVPLTFNKFDLRDYLLHAYRTPVLAVRSQLRQQRPTKSKTNGRIYRPVPIKTMTVQLAQPFEWPAMPEDLSPWKPDNLARAKKQQEETQKLEETSRNAALFPLRENMRKAKSWTNMRAEAKRLLQEGGWSNKRDLDPRFTEKEEEGKKR